MLKRKQIGVAVALFIGLVGVSLSSGLAAAQVDGSSMVLAKRGKDDAAGDDRGTHGAGHPKSEQVLELAKRGKDDAAGDDRGTHGAGHPKSEQIIELARRGADDVGGGRREDRRADRRKA